MVLSGFRPIVLVLMAGECSGFPGSALNSLPRFLFFLNCSGILCISVAFNGKAYAWFRKKGWVCWDELAISCVAEPCLNPSGQSLRLLPRPFLTMLTVVSFNKMGGTGGKTFFFKATVHELFLNTCNHKYYYKRFLQSIIHMRSSSSRKGNINKQLQKEKGMSSVQQNGKLRVA